MKYFSILAIIATALAAQSFTVAPIRSGNRFQYAGISSDRGNLYVGQNNQNGRGNNVDFVLNDDGTLYNRATGNFINIEDNNKMVESDQGWSRFRIQDNTLVSQDNQRFYACPTNRADRNRDGRNRDDYRNDRTDRSDRSNLRNQYTLGLSACSGGTPIALRLNNIQNVENVNNNNRWDDERYNNDRWNNDRYRNNRQDRDNRRRDA